MKKPMSARVEWQIAAQISAYVAEGRLHKLIELFPDAAINPPPSRIGDWELMVVTGYHHKTREPETHVIATAKSYKTQRITKRGNLLRLKNMGFSEPDARSYNEAGNGVTNAWIEQVICLVKHLLDMRLSYEAVTTIMDNQNPRLMARQIGVCDNAFEYTAKRFHAGTTMLKKIREIEQRRQAEKVERELLNVD